MIEALKGQSAALEKIDDLTTAFHKGQKEAIIDRGFKSTMEDRRIENLTQKINTLQTMTENTSSAIAPMMNMVKSLYQRDGLILAFGRLINKTIGEIKSSMYLLNTNNISKQDLNEVHSQLSMLTTTVEAQNKETNDQITTFKTEMETSIRELTDATKNIAETSELKELITHVTEKSKRILEIVATESANMNEIKATFDSVLGLNIKFFKRFFKSRGRSQTQRI